MSAEQENVSILRKGYELWSKSKAGSAEHWIDLMSDDELCWRSLAGGAAGVEFTRDCHSKSEVRGYFETLTTGWEMLDYTIDEYIAQGDRVVALGRCSWKNRASGKSVSTPKADVIRFRNGKIVDFVEFYDTATMIAAATA